MKSILTIFLFFLTISLHAQDNNDETFGKALRLLTQNIKKDSVDLIKQIDNLKEQISEIEKKNDFTYEKIQEWLSLNFLGQLEQVQEDYLKKYFEDWELTNLESTQNFIDKFRSKEENEPDMMFFGMDHASDEPENKELEKYKRLSLKLKELEFKQSVQLVLHVFDKNYNQKLISRLDTEEFKFDKVLIWLQENKKEEAVYIIQPAILEKSFKIALNAMLQ